MNLQDYLNRLSTLSGEELYKRINQQYGGMGGFSTAYNQAMAKIQDSQQRQIAQQILGQIETKIGEYLKNKQARQQSAQAVEQNKPKEPELQTNINIPTTLRPPKLGKEPTEYDYGRLAGFNEAVSQFGNKLKEIQQATNKALEGFKQKLGMTDQQIQAIRSRFDVFNTKINLIDNIIKSKDQVYQSLFKGLKENLDTLSKKYGDTYAKIGERINNYEKLMENTFNKMQERLNTIGENYKKILQFNQAAAGSAAEKQLRGATGKGAALRVANYLQEFAQKGDESLAKLQAQLAQQANALDQEFLRLKKLIINDKNMNDKEKMAALDNLQQRYNNLLNLKAKWGIDKIDMYSQPRQEEIAYQEQKVNAKEQAQLANEIQKLNYEWQTKPENRDIIINRLISNLGVEVPMYELERLKTEPDFNKALLEFSNYIIRTQKDEAARAKAQLLQQQAQLLQKMQQQVQQQNQPTTSFFEKYQNYTLADFKNSEKMRPIIEKVAAEAPELLTKKLGEYTDIEKKKLLNIINGK